MGEVNGRTIGTMDLQHMGVLEERLHVALRYMSLRYGIGYTFTRVAYRWFRWAAKQWVTSPSVNHAWRYGDIL
jgi:hypothetical protein